MKRSASSSRSGTSRRRHKLARDLGKVTLTDEAVEAAREALSYFDRKGVVPAIARTHALLAELGAAGDSG